jgi:hypothetical protein
VADAALLEDLFAFRRVALIRGNRSLRKPKQHDRACEKCKFLHLDPLDKKLVYNFPARAVTCSKIVLNC